MEAFLSWLPWLFISAVVFFALGWLGARIDVKHLLTESRELPRAYFQGLNFLLNEQPDKAIEALLEASRQHPEVVELQFALGSLFRRRGEIDRALRVHKALSERSGLSVDDRVAALYETALDYHKSGLLDHAEKILLDVVDMRGTSEARRHLALALLLNLYQQERNWRRAIDIARMLDSDLPVEKRKHAAEIANFHCELATEQYALGGDSRTDAYLQLEHAMREYPLCVRANLLRGQWLQAEGQHAEALLAWRSIAKQDPSYLGLAAEGILRAHQALGAGAAGIAELSQMQAQHPSLDIFNILFKATLQEQGPDAAVQLVKEDLRLNPTLVGLDHLLEARVLGANDENKADLETLKSLVHSHASRLAVYLCRSCGFKAKQWYWHCPACNGWDTFPPRRTAEYDTAERHLARLQAEHIDTQKNKRG
jgi:lipopolysaccharide biosynthesis regulator YciM